MKQILQNLGSGETVLAEIPCPAPREGHVLIESAASLVSLGTEKMLVDFGRSGWIAKARSQPEKVQQVLQKIRSDGLFATIDAVKSKLDQPIPLGYSNVGRVAESQSSDSTFQMTEGTRVVSNGGHAEMVSVPKNLCAVVPEGVSDEAAAFTVVGAIGLQGIRLLEPMLGERVVVMGLGLIGLLTVQMLRANGCRVLGVDLDSEKCDLARGFGAEVCDLSKGEDAVSAAAEFSEGRGVDGVLITASAKTDSIVHDAATMCRKRGRIVLVGVVGLHLNRSDFYEKELSFQVSCSYGPGRYDADYEGKGVDYPFGFVRWTEQRNMEAVLQLLADGSLETGALISHRFDFGEALDAYEVVSKGGALGILLRYAQSKVEKSKVEGRDTGKYARTVSVGAQPAESTNQRVNESPGISFIGAGNFTVRQLLPALKEMGGVRFRSVVSGSGMGSGTAAGKFGFETAGTDPETVFSDAETDAVFITTPHDSHAKYVCLALRAGKHVFVEKPLCLTLDELEEITELRKHRTAETPLLAVGFNRRYSPHAIQLQEWLQGCSGTKSVVITVNAGAIPGDHWTQDPKVGGGRIIGEGCHFVDLARFLVSSPITESRATFLGGTAGQLGDSASLQLRFADESIATVHYLATGDKSFPKERVEVFADGKIMTCDNFRVTKGYGVKGSCKTRRPEKGHAECLAAFMQAVKTGGPAPIAVEEILEVAEHTIRMVRRA